MVQTNTSPTDDDTVLSLDDGAIVETRNEPVQLSKRRRNENDKVQTELLKSCVEILKKDDDDIEKFIQFIGSDLRALSQVNQTIVKRRILSLMMEYTPMAVENIQIVFENNETE